MELRSFGMLSGGAISLQLAFYKSFEDLKLSDELCQIEIIIFASRHNISQLLLTDVVIKNSLWSCS